MIATLVFVVAFILLGLSVFFVALNGGARGARRSLQTQTRGGGRTIGIVIGVVVLAGVVAIPIAVMVNNANSQADAAPGGLTLTADQEHGRHLFAANCATCHTLHAANAVGKVGPNLDSIRPPEALVINAINVGRARGNGQMPAQLLTGPDEKDVASFVAAAAGR